MRNAFGLLSLSRNRPSGGPPFDETGIVGWYMGDKGVTAPGNAVSAVADQSAAGNNATGTATLVPAGLNGLPYFQFNGTSDALATATNISFVGGDLSMFLVIREHTANNFAPSAGVISGSGSGFLRSSITNISTLTHIMAARASANSGIDSGDIAAPSWHKVSYVVRTAGTEELWVDNVGTPSSIGGPIGSPLSISLAGFSVFGSFSNVDIAEAIFFNTNKESTRAAIETYLAGKWGV